MIQKHITTIILILLPTLLMAQTYFSKYYDPFDHSSEVVNDLKIVGDSIYLAARGTCNNFEDECFKFAIVDLEGNLLEANENDTFESGLGMEVEDGSYYVDGGNEPINDRMYLYKSSLDGSSDTLITLLPPTDRYIYPVNKSIVKTEDHVIVYGTTRDTVDPQTNGVPKVKGVLFWINKSDLSLDSMLIIEPPYDFLRIEDATIDNEGNVLFVVYHDGLFPPNNLEGQFKSIYKFNSNKELIWQWTSEPNLATSLSFSSIAVLPNDNVIISVDDFDYSVPIESIICINIDGEIVWQNGIDDDFKTTYDIANIDIMNNGDFIIVGIVGGVPHKYGITAALTRFSQEGNVLYHKVFLVDPDNDYINPPDWASISGLSTVSELPNGDLVVSGQVWSQYDDPVAGLRHDKDMWVMRLDSTGCLTAECDTHQIVRHQTVACAEPDFRVVDPRNQWNVTSSAGLGSYYTTKQRFKKDSVLIDNKYYFQIETEETEFGEDWVDYPLYVRECEGLLFGRASEDEEEELYFDFNMEVGDMLKDTDYVGYADLMVIEINNIEYLDGSIRKRLTIEAQNGFGIFQMIEGVGSSVFPLTDYANIAIIDYWNQLGCFTTNDEIVYVGNSFSSCWPVGVNDEIGNIAINIFPNPTNGYLNIQSDIELTEIEIYDTQGKLILKLDYSASIDISFLHEGLYLVVLKNINGNSLRERVLKL